MSLVRCQIKNFAHILDKKLLFPDVNQIARTISNVNLDLNPHQVEVALFALSKPFSSGVILTDNELPIFIAVVGHERKLSKLLIYFKENTKKAYLTKWKLHETGCFQNLMML